jgi:hypothetical protein
MAAEAASREQEEEEEYPAWTAIQQDKKEALERSLRAMRGAFKPGVRSQLVTKYPNGDFQSVEFTTPSEHALNRESAAQQQPPPQSAGKSEKKRKGDGSYSRKREENTRHTPSHWVEHFGEDSGYYVGYTRDLRGKRSEVLRCRCSGNDTFPLAKVWTLGQHLKSDAHKLHMKRYLVGCSRSACCCEFSKQRRCCVRSTISEWED